MIFGILKDIKVGEFRVICTPSEISTIIDDGHEVFVQSNAGGKAGFSDEDYISSGARIVESMEEIYEKCDFVAKVKSFEKTEYPLFRKGQILFTCIHPAGNSEEVQALLDSEVIAFTAEDSHRFGSPNCEAAGKQGALKGLQSLESISGGSGKFVCGLAGAPGINVVIVGGGLVGKSALQVFYGLGASVTVMDINIGTLRGIEQQYDGKVNTMISSKYNLTKILPTMDIVINSVKWLKTNKEYMITREMVASMKKGSVIVDISNDYGCIETFKPTTHENPRYVEEGVVHYCVENIPGSIANSTSIAYAASVIGHFRSIMNKGVKQACINDGYLRRSMTVYKGYLTHEETSAVQDRKWIKPEQILNIENEELDFAPRATLSRSNNFINKDSLR